MCTWLTEQVLCNYKLTVPAISTTLTMQLQVLETMQDSYINGLFSLEVARFTVSLLLHFCNLLFAHILCTYVQLYVVLLLGLLTKTHLSSMALYTCTF